MWSSGPSLEPLRPLARAATLEPVKCDHCENEATSHETQKVGGQLVERHLCEKCARDIAALAGPGGLPKVIKTIEQLKAQGLTGAGGGGGQAGGQAGGPPGSQSGPSTGRPVAPMPGACAACGLTYALFRQSGMLGCPECYQAFESQLWPLLSRAHEGGTHHVGKIPRRASTQAGDGPSPGRAAALFGSVQERAERIVILRQQLAEAVGAEQYERAAQLRDELRKLGDLRTLNQGGAGAGGTVGGGGSGGGGPR